MQPRASAETTFLVL